MLICGCTVSPHKQHSVDLPALTQEVFAAERAFARTMAERDLQAFTTFLSNEAIFFSAERAIRGKATVSTEWQPFFEGPQAPFSWEPDQVEVLDSGRLAFSTGPVYDPAGKCIGSFNSVWRREGPAEWRVVFDKGSSECPSLQ
ncbi:nuclear transport factor 2 family protein [Proteobacteria bacterium 005FR1]|nr:nuclear transport factor 2 family protein [Proteobacteria bacterium 005FR1]